MTEVSKCHRKKDRLYTGPDLLYSKQRSTLPVSEGLRNCEPFHREYCVVCDHSEKDCRGNCEHAAAENA